MAPSRKSGAHRVPLNLPLLAAGSASDSSAGWTYDAYALGGTVTSPNTPYDVSSQSITEASYTVDTTLTGQGTHFASICLQLIRAGAVLNQLSVAYSGTGIVTTAYTFANLAVASGAVVPNAGTGVLAVTGAVLPWILLPGDFIALQRLSNDSTGLATPSISLTFLLQAAGA